MARRAEARGAPLRSRAECGARRGEKSAACGWKKIRARGGVITGEKMR